MKTRNLASNDVVAANLLFATLALAVLYQVVGWVTKALAPMQTVFHPVNFSATALAGLAVFLGLRAGLYYGVRVGLLAAKWLVALGFIAFVILHTHWRAGTVAGVAFHPFRLDSLILLLTDTLTLAALVVMFGSERKMQA